MSLFKLFICYLIFLLIILNLIFIKNVSATNVVIYNHGLTTAVTAYGRDGQIAKCHLYLEKTEDSPSPKLGLSGISVTKVTFGEMMKILKECHSLSEKLEPKTSKWQLATVFRGIVPGTMWCGRNDIAQSYDQLGSDHRLDICCRTHDHCPVRIQPMQKRFNLFNLSFYTKSHCLCDEILYECLKKCQTAESDLIGNIYFNLFKVQCVSENENKTFNGNVDDKGFKRYRFVDAKRKWPM